MKQQSGFTLIELVVVIVVLGILAATAVPRFATVTDDANTAVAQGILGAIYSAAALQVAANNGAAPTFAQIMDNLDCEVGGAVVTVVTGTGGADDTCTTTNSNACTAAAGDTVTVTVDGDAAPVGNLSASLCAN